MTHYVYSTATNGIIYTKMTENNQGPAKIIRKVEIKGGHGVATVKNLHTPRGIVTSVTDDEMDFLLANESFKNHVERGFMSYDKKEVAPEKKAKDMTQKDGSAPLTPADFVEGENSTKDNPIYTKK